MPGVEPFIVTLPMHGDGTQNLASVTYTIAPAAGAVSKPVTVRQSMAYLTRCAFMQAGDTAFVLPVFGLYAGQSNAVTLTLSFTDDFAPAY